MLPRAPWGGESAGGPPFERESAGIGAGGTAALAAPSAIPTLAAGFGKAASSSYVGKILGAKTMGEAVIKAQLYEAGFKKLLHMAFGRDRL
jgi:hypothetical protein